MNTAASENYHLGRGQGFAIPINEAMAIAGQIQGGGGSPTVHIGPTAFLGVGVNDAPGGGGRHRQAGDSDRSCRRGRAQPRAT